MKTYFVYIMTNKGRSTLYTGITNSLLRRVTQHRNGEIQGFTRRYNTNRLIYYEQFNDARDAIAREKQIKGWSRRKKEELIAVKNPNWMDMAVTLLGIGIAPTTHWQAQGGYTKHQNVIGSHPERSEGSLCY